MPIMPVRLYLDPILKQPTELVTNFNSEELFKLSQDVVETMFAYKGIGLAAPQIGVNKNLAVLHLENKSKILVIANPRILCYTKEEEIQLEGCLSAPGISINIKRPLAVEVEAQNLLGDIIQYRFTDFDSRILQHEFDHLQGILITQGLIKL